MNDEQSEFGLNGFLQGFEFAEFGSSSALFAIVLLVNGHDACASEAEVVLKRVLQIGNLSLGSDPSQLPTKLSACINLSIVIGKHLFLYIYNILLYSLDHRIYLKEKK